MTSDRPCKECKHIVIDGTLKSAKCALTVERGQVYRNPVTGEPAEGLTEYRYCSLTRGYTVDGRFSRNLLKTFNQNVEEGFCAGFEEKEVIKTENTPGDATDKYSFWARLWMRNR